jgi:hypothetical protein
MTVHDWTVHGYIGGCLGTWMKFLENQWRKKEGVLFLFFKGKSCRGKSQVTPQVLEIQRNQIKFLKLNKRVCHTVASLAIYIKKCLKAKINK